MRKLLAILLLFPALLLCACGGGEEKKEDRTLLDGAYEMNETFSLGDIEVCVPETVGSALAQPAGKRAVEVHVRYSADKTLTLANVSAVSLYNERLSVLTAGAQDSMEDRRGGDVGFATFSVPDEVTEFVMYFEKDGAKAHVHIIIN